MMIILEDTRQQANKHDAKHKWFAEHGIEVMRTKLLCGDYTLPTDQSVCIDTKKDFQEIIGNLTGSQHKRFREEAERAQSAGLKLIFLIENDGGEVKKGTNIYNPVITRLEDVHKWKNPRLFIMYRGKQKYPKATKGITLQKIMRTFSKRYGCEFRFCHSKDSAKLITEILTQKDGDPGGFTKNQE